ncbi:MAG TPA: hypothetical protein EYP07_12580 [Kiloniellaceae bacterium]|nr:hypothetical protein [Kiloniellaceae bacterium]
MRFPVASHLLILLLVLQLPAAGAVPAQMNPAQITLAQIKLTQGSVAQAATQTSPQAPCPAGVEPFPAYAPAGAPPAIAVWQDVTLPSTKSADEFCGAELTGSLDTVAALAGRFRHAGTVDDLAARFGAVSGTVGQLYWSTTDQRWRVLVEEATALEGPEGETPEGETPEGQGREDAQPRADFTAAEVRSGRALTFAQNDSRSSGNNLYRLRALAAGPDRLVVEIVNLEAIRFTLLTIFEPGGLVSLHVLERLDGDLWGAYSLTAVREGSGAGRPESLVNRAAAFHRFLLGRPGDDGAPLAP